MKKILFFYLFCFPLVLGAQSWEGTWEGILLQPSHRGMAHGYPFWMILHEKGDSIWGFSRIEIHETRYFAVMVLKGIVRGDTAYLVEDLILQQQSKPQTIWFVKNIQLQRPSARAMKGRWDLSDTLYRDETGEIILQESRRKFNYTKTQRLRNSYDTYRSLAGSALFVAEKNLVFYSQVVDSIRYQGDSLLWQEPGTDLLVGLSLMLNKYPNLYLKVFFEDCPAVSKRRWRKRLRKMVRYMKKAGRVHPDRIVVAERAYVKLPADALGRQRLWFQMSL
jgi:hypothetical protein